LYRLHPIRHQRLRRRRFGQLALITVTSAAIDKLYENHLLAESDGTKRLRQAQVSVAIMKTAWKVVGRLYRDAVPAENLWARGDD
jgi:hypothetical protein